MKPIRPGESSTIEAAIELIEKMGLKGVIQAKVDGVHVSLVVHGAQRKAFTEDGQDITDILEEKLSRFPDGEYILDGEVETWIDGKHQPRECTAGHIHARRKENLTITVFDCLYDKVDLRAFPFHKRLATLKRICKDWEKTMDPPKTDLIILPSIEVNTKSDLKEAIEKVLAHKDKEGFIWKSYDGLYVPNKNSGYQVKWHRSAIIEGKVLGSFETAVRGVFNYEWGIPIEGIPAKRVKTIEGSNCLVIGKTFSSKIKYNIGDPIKVEVETINLVLDDEEIDLTGWAPKIVEEA